MDFVTILAIFGYVLSVTIGVVLLRVFAELKFVTPRRWYHYTLLLIWPVYFLVSIFIPRRSS